MTATCSNCSTAFRNADRNEDGQPEIEATRCAHPDCQVYLCAEGCQELSFLCTGGCNKRFCELHAIFTVGGEHFCGECYLELRRAVLSDAGCTVEEAAAFIKVVA